MGFYGIGKRSVGSYHLRDDSVVTRAIADDTILELDVSPNVIGYGRLTAGLQGSLGGDIAGLHFEHGRMGSLTTPVWTDRSLGSYDITQGNYYYGITYLPDKKKIMVCKTNAVQTNYLITIGTTAGNLVGSVKITGITGNHIVYGIALAPDTNNIWACIKPADLVTRIYEIGTRTGAVIGSSPISNIGGGMDLAYADDTGHLYITDNEYIYEVGTTTGAMIGSFFKVADPNGPHGIAFNSDHHHLFYSNASNQYVNEIGTTTGNELGSFKVPSGNSLLFFNPSNQLELYIKNTTYVNRIGTNFGRAYSGTYVHFQTAFSAAPTVAIGQIGDLGDKSVFAMDPVAGSFWLKAGTYLAKSMWMAWGLQ